LSKLADEVETDVDHGTLRSQSEVPRRFQM
jgi:hypothetical protein